MEVKTDGEVGYLTATRKITGEKLILKCDIADLPMLSQYPWHVAAKCSSVSRYVNINGKSTTQLLHRLLVGTRFVIFLNNDKLDFRRSNLKGIEKGIRDRKCGQYLKGNPYISVPGAGVTMWTTKDGARVNSFLIDEDDLDRVCQFTWGNHTNGYIASSISCGKNKRKVILLHRFIMDANKGDEVDHINQVKSDNRKANLRFCSSSENKHNAGLRNSNTSGVIGVTKSKKSWEACIEKDKERIRKTFPTFEQAVAQRKAWEKEYNPSGLNHASV